MKTPNRHCLPLATALACLFAIGASTNLQAAEPTPSAWDIFADFRARLESDWDSQRADGVRREDRDRARIRARFGLTFTPAGPFSFGLRARSGDKDSQQSPHATVIDFDGGDTGPNDINLDRWYARWQSGGGFVWAGRNNLPFWMQNELFWDDDVTPVGVALGHGNGALQLKAGYFALPVGMRDFSGNLAGAQIVYSGTLGDTGLSAAFGGYDFDADRNDPDAAKLRGGNGRRDYTVLLASLQAKHTLAGRPLALGLDTIHNTRNYAASEPARKQRDGFVLSATYGQNKAAGDWLTGYSYARIETLAVNAAYAQDDWLRWGSATQTDASDFKGHEFRVGYALNARSNLLLRLYLVEAISSQQDGKRLRLDYNIAF